MPEINYNALKNHLKELKEKGLFAPVYLIYGEELLYKTAFENLLDAMVPVSARSLSHESVDGSNENIHEVIERINTFSLLPGIKVVSITDSRIFYSKQDETLLLEKAKEAYDKNDIKKAAKYLVNLLGLLNLSFDDIQKENRNKKLKLDADILGDGDWLDKITFYCMDNSLSIPADKDNAGILQKAIEKGFPKGNHLIITTDMVDKRRSLYKTINKNGMIIDCSVPKGDRKADKAVQEAVLNERMNSILAQSKKTIDRGAYMAMYEMTGFDLRTFSNNLEKLVNYVGDRRKITIDDVVSVLKRTKKDPIYELTNAISDKSIEKALFFLDSLLSDNIYPLQILSAITNQIRKLLLVKDFVESSYGSAWHSGISFGQFKNSIMSSIQEYDRIILGYLEDWESKFSKDVDADNKTDKKGRAKKKSKSVTDLIVAKNPKNPYPVYQMLLKSEKFTKDDLLAAIECLNKADLKIKSTGRSPKLILEEAIFHICRPR